MKLKNARYLSRDLIAGLVRPGDAVVDATAGNGHDTQYLAELVGPGGTVYAFDVQRAALEQTCARLAQAGLDDGRVRLILDGHEHMAAHVDKPVRLALFNLGWLPSGDHSLTTRVPTTLEAVRQAMALLAPGGMVSVCVYPGHEEGEREWQALNEALARVEIREYNVLSARFANQRPDAPRLLLIQREGEA